MIGKNIFKGPAKWDGYEIIMHSGSEHTVDGKRFDFEIQILHTVHPEDETGTYGGANGEDKIAANGGHRNLAGA